jgi:hypothetical protein
VICGFGGEKVIEGGSIASELFDLNHDLAPGGTSAQRAHPLIDSLAAVVPFFRCHRDASSTT